MNKTYIKNVLTKAAYYSILVYKEVSSMKALDLAVMSVNSNSCGENVIMGDSFTQSQTEIITAHIGKLTSVKQAAPLPTIPEVKFVVTKGDLVEEFESYRELYLWAVDQRDINRCAREEFCDFSGDMSPRDIREFSLVEYVSEHAFRLLEENEYTVDRVPKTFQEIAHSEGKPCDEDDCQDCCGEFVGHEYDSSEGGYCINCNHHEND